MTKLDIKEENGKIFCPLKDEWHISTPEEKVRQKYIQHLINDYGYSPKQMAQEVQVSNSQRGQGKARADIVIWKSEKDKNDGKNAFIVVECKAENVKIHQEDYFQGFNYASWAGASFFVTTNQKETKYFNVDRNFLPKKLDEVIAIPNATEANNEKKIKELLNQTKTFTREEFTRMLFKCHNIIRNNDKLSPEAAFDEISKILFMKINFEKDKKGSKVFTLVEFKQQEKNYEENIRPELTNEQKNWPYMQFLFSRTKRFYSDDKLFEDNEMIKIRQNSFEAIILELQKYNLSDTSDDVKGIAFEEFLGKTFRGELGQFFTPRTIVDFMTHILDPQESETICDPTCGSGGFLIKSFEYVRETIENKVQEAKEKFKAQLIGGDYDNLDEKGQNKINIKINQAFNILNRELDAIEHKGLESRLYSLSHNCIYGTDANPRMARTSKMNMIMHGDGHGGVHHHDGLLNVNGIFEERFDVILTNPPFGARIDKSIIISEIDKFKDQEVIEKYRKKYGSDYDNALRQVNNNIGKPLLNLFDVGEMSGLTEVLFMERCLKLLKKGGRMGIVLPEGVLNTSNLQKVRDYFEGKAKIILICSIPQDVFIAAGATVKPSLVFFKRFTEDEERKYADVTNRARSEIRATYNDEIVSLNGELKLLNNHLQDKFENKAELRAKIREINRCLKSIEEAIIEEAKPLIKEYFDYEIPIAKVNDGGITTTGAKTDNLELIQLEKEFANYNKSAKLWEVSQISISYNISDDGKVFRVVNGKEIELTW